MTEVEIYLMYLKVDENKKTLSKYDPIDLHALRKRKYIGCMYAWMAGVQRRANGSTFKRAADCNEQRVGYSL